MAQADKLNYLPLLFWFIFIFLFFYFIINIFILPLLFSIFKVKKYLLNKSSFLSYHLFFSLKLVNILKIIYIKNILLY